MLFSQDHLTGKQYLGWKKIRETYAELIKQREERLRGGPLPERVRSSSKEAAAAAERGSSRDRERERERERGSSRDHDRERERGSSRDHRGSSRDYRGSSRAAGDFRDPMHEREIERRERERSPRRRSDRDRDRDHRGDRRYSEHPPPGYDRRSEVGPGWAGSHK